MVAVPAGSWGADSGLADVIPIMAGLTPEAEATGIAASTLVGPEGPILVVLGGILTEILGGGNANAQRAQNAINTALAANEAGNTQAQLNMGAEIYSSFKVSALLAEGAAGAAFAGAQALQRVKALIDSSPSAATIDAIQAEIASAFSDIAITGNQVRAYADAAVANEAAQRNAQATAVLNQAVLEARTDFARAEQDIQAALDQAVLEARTDSTAVVGYVQQVEASLVDDLQQAVAQTNAAIAALENYISGGLATAGTYAETTTAAGLSGLQAAQNQQLQTTLTPTWAGTAASANEATEQLVQQHPEEAGGLSLIPSNVPEDATAAIAGLAAGLKTATQALNDCVLPTCKQTSQLGNDLKSLLGAVGSGVLLAFIVEAVKDPKATATDAERVVGTVAHDMVSAVQAVVGLA